MIASVLGQGLSPQQWSPPPRPLSAKVVIISPQDSCQQHSRCHIISPSISEYLPYDSAWHKRSAVEIQCLQGQRLAQAVGQVSIAKEVSWDRSRLGSLLGSLIGITYISSKMVTSTASPSYSHSILVLAYVLSMLLIFILSAS